MSDIDLMTKETPRLTPDDIIAWLRDNPRFLQQNPEVCDFLLPPKENKGKGIADFQHYMVKRLKADRDEVVEATRDIVETSRANMSNQARIHTAVLMLLEAQNFEDFIRTITMDFATILDIDIVTMIVETDGVVIPHIDLQGVRAVPAGSVEQLTSGRPVILQSHINGLEELYGGGAKLVTSQAFLTITLSQNTPPALIAFGSRNPEQFQDGQGTELIAFLGKVIERCFRAWLDLPPQ